jgi:hypothetical protein
LLKLIKASPTEEDSGKVFHQNPLYYDINNNNNNNGTKASTHKYIKLTQLAEFFLIEGLFCGHNEALWNQAMIISPIRHG